MLRAADSRRCVSHGQKGPWEESKAYGIWRDPHPRAPSAWAGRPQQKGPVPGALPEAQQRMAPDKGTVGGSLMGEMLQVVQMCPTSRGHLLSQRAPAQTAN